MANIGKIVVCGDEWTLSDVGFRSCPDGTRFAANIADWFADGGKGNFYGWSQNFGILQDGLRKAMEDAGHSWASGSSIPFTLESLRTYDGIFLAGDAVDNNVLIDYVRQGGCVYVAGGTGWGGGPAGEARRWKAFLNTFGLKMNEFYDGIAGRITIESDHRIFAGVKALYYSNGSPITDIDPGAPENSILVPHPKGGLIAVYDASLAPVRISITDLLYDGEIARTEADEYIQISNEGTAPVDLSGWRVNAGDGGQNYTFPDGTTINAGQTIRVYTNQVHAESGGFSFGSKQSIWNNKGDVGYLYNARGDEVASHPYGDAVKRDIPDVLREQGIPGAKVEADAREAQSKLGGSVDFLTALERAIVSLVNDPADGDDYTAATAVSENWDGGDSLDAEGLQRAIRDHINTQTIILCTQDSAGLEDADLTVADAWVFELRAGMGDIHFVSVPRDGSAPKQFIS